jgi:hypothetical protein
MAKRVLAVTFGAVLVVPSFTLLNHPRPVRAQTTGHLQIASITLGPPQTLAYPAGPVQKAPASTQSLYFFPDEIMTFMPPASSGGPYLMFDAGTLSTNGLSGTTVLQSTDLQNWTFATGYQPLLIVPPVNVWQCNPTYDQTSFDENYAGSGFVAQDWAPTA